MNDFAKFQNYTMTLPEGGPISIPDSYNFVAATPIVADLSQLIENGWMDYISGVYIDNTQNAGYLTIECFGTNQKFYFPARYSGYVPLFLPNPPKLTLQSTETATVKFQWYNIPVFPLLLPDPTHQLSNGTFLTDYTITLSGGNDTLVTGGQAANYIYIENKAANGDVTVNLAGGDATLQGLVLTNAAGYASLYQNEQGISNSITIHGTAGNVVTCYAG